MQKQSNLSTLLSMYALKNDVDSFKQVLNQMDKGTKETTQAIQDCFVTACKRNSVSLVDYYINSELFVHIGDETLQKALLKIGYQKGSKVLSLLLNHDEVKNKLNYNDGVLYSIFHLEDKDNVLELLLELKNEGKYSFERNENMLFVMAINFGSQEIFDYLFENETVHKKPEDRLKEVVLGEIKSVEPMLLHFLYRYRVELTYSEIEDLKSRKSELFNVMQKNNLFKLSCDGLGGQLDKGIGKNNGGDVVKTKKM